MAADSSPEVRRCVVEITHFLANEPNLLEQNKIQIDGEGLSQLATCIALMTDDLEKDIVFKFIQKMAITQAEDVIHWIGARNTFLAQILKNATSSKPDVQDLALAALLKLTISVDTVLALIKLGAANIFIGLLNSVAKEKKRQTARILEKLIRSGYGHATVKASEVTILVGLAQASEDAHVRADILHTLHHLCNSSEIRQNLRQVGASAAIKFVSNEITMDQALLLLHRLVDDDNLGIKADGTIELQPLVDLVCRPDHHVNHIAADVLAKLIMKISSAESFVKKFGFEVVNKLAESEEQSGEIRREAASHIIRQLTQNNFYWEEILERVGVKRLISLLSSIKATVTVKNTLEVLLALASIHKARELMVKEGIIKILATLSESPDSETELASTAILQKLSQVEQYRAFIAKEQGIRPLSKLSSNTPPEISRIIQTLTFTENHVLAEDSNLSELISMMYSTDATVQIGACWFVASISSNHANHEPLIASQTIEALLVALQKGMTDESKAQAACGIRNFAENPSVAANYLSSEFVVGALTESLKSPYVELNRHAAWALKFLAALNADNRDMITEAKAFPLLEKLQMSQTFAVEQAASAAIGALTPPDQDLALLQAISSGLVPARKLQRCTRDQIARFMLIIWNGIVKKQRGELATVLSTKIKQHKRLRMASSSLRKSKMSNIETDLGLDEADSVISDTYQFYEDLAKRELKKGDNITAPNICDLVFGEGVPITEITVKTIFNSKTKPALLSLKYAHGLEARSIVFKTGDDVRKDMLVMNLFDLFNTLWECSYLNPVPFVYRYEVIPLSDDTGALEFISNSTTVTKFDWSLIEALPENELETFLSSVVGALCAGWVLGIRDRHDDNMLIKDGRIFCQIDFGWIFNTGPTFDAPRLAVPEALKRLLEVKNLWNTVKDRFVEAFIVLRRASGLIGHITSILFSSLVPEDRLTESLSEAWFPNKTEGQAKAELQSRFDAWLTNFQKRFKDFTHGLRQ